MKNYVNVFVNLITKHNKLNYKNKKQKEIEITKDKTKFGMLN